MQNRGYLDFNDFRRFVKGLKARPELDRLHKKLSQDFGGILTYAAFERFMRTTQKVRSVYCHVFSKLTSPLARSQVLVTTS